MSREVIVRVADLQIGSSGDVLVTLGLGSCVAIILHDQSRGVGGLAHVMLPSPSLGRRSDSAGKVPQTAIPAMLQQMTAMGANPRKVTGRLVGGASLFTALTPTGSIQMGERNVVASREVLNRLAIPLVGESVGGTAGRSVWLDVTEGKVLIRSAARIVQSL